MPNAREEIAKFPEIWRAARTKTACIWPASAAHALKNVAELDGIEDAFRSEKARVRRRDHANVAPKSRERNVKFSKIFSAPRAQKVACTRLACDSILITSSTLFTKS